MLVGMTGKPAAIRPEENWFCRPPDGVLDGSVVDARSGSPVSKARITLHRDEPDSMYSATLPPDGQFRFALPPVPIQVSIDAPGYRRRVYKDPASAAPHITLSTSEDKNIVIKLEPIP
jgi:hypothetical protein